MAAPIGCVEAARHSTGRAGDGCVNQASDTARAAWLRSAFQFAHSRKFVLVTYYNYRHRYWQIDRNTRAGEALRREIELY